MRIFVAVEVTDIHVLENIKKIQSNLQIKAKPVEIHNLHFTLFFIGEVSEDVANKIKVNLSKIKFSPFKVNFEGLGAFPKPSFPRVIWIGTDRISGESLTLLAKNVEDALIPLGFKSDKPFKPHLTIFRVKSKLGNISEKMALLNSNYGMQNVTELKLKKSELTPNGPIYSDLLIVRGIN